MIINYRLIKDDENSFLEEMLYEALFVAKGEKKFPKSILQNPDINKYIKSWGQQKDDISIVAVFDDNLVGAIWGRKFQSENKGYGYINENTPEISMAVKKECRNCGIGTELLEQIEIEYAKIGVKQLSLSVNKLNPATLFYKKAGYKLHEEKETALTMIKSI